MPAFITQVLVPILLGLELANSVWCGDLAGLTDTRVLGFDQHGTPVVWKDGVSPYEIPKSRHTGEVEVWFPRHPPTPFTNFGKQEGYHYMFQVWFTYNEAGFTPTTGGLSDVGTGKAGATQLGILTSSVLLMVRSIALGSCIPRCRLPGYRSCSERSSRLWK